MNLDTVEEKMPSGAPSLNLMTHSWMRSLLTERSLADGTARLTLLLELGLVVKLSQLESSPESSQIL